MGSATTQAASKTKEKISMVLIITPSHCAEVTLYKYSAFAVSNDTWRRGCREQAAFQDFKPVFCVKIRFVFDPSPAFTPFFPYRPCFGGSVRKVL